MERNKARMALRTFYGFDYHVKLCNNIQSVLDSGKSLGRFDEIQQGYRMLVGVCFSFQIWLLRQVNEPNLLSLDFVIYFIEH